MGISTIPRIGFSTVRFSASRDRGRLACRLFAPEGDGRHNVDGGARGSSAVASGPWSVGRARPARSNLGPGCGSGYVAAGI